MFVLTTVTRDCKNGDLYVSVDDNAYLTKEAASTALRARYEDFLKSMELEDNGASDENGNAMAMISTWSLKWMTLNMLLFLRISRRSSKILSGNP